MQEIDLLPDHIRQHSLSDQEIILNYEWSCEALNYFYELGYATLGFEQLTESFTGDLIEISNFVSFLPETFDWDLFVEDSYQQVQKQLDKADEAILYSNYNVDKVYYCLTFIQFDEFDSLYFEYIHVD